MDDAKPMTVLAGTRMNTLVPGSVTAGVKAGPLTVMLKSLAMLITV